MTPEEKIRVLISKYAEERALCLHRYCQLREGETRDWDYLPAEERKAKLWYAEHLIKKEMPEVFE